MLKIINGKELRMLGKTTVSLQITKLGLFLEHNFIHSGM